MAREYDFVTGDTASSLQVTCKDKGTGAVIDLTDCSVILRWRKLSDGTEVEKAMSFVGSATLGVVKYQFEAGDLEAGKMKFEVEITDGSGHILTLTELIVANVREELG